LGIFLFTTESTPALGST